MISQKGRKTAWGRQLISKKRDTKTGCRASSEAVMYTVALQFREYPGALRIQPSRKDERKGKPQQRQQGETGRCAYPATREEISPQWYEAHKPAGEDADYHGSALLDGSDLAGPGEYGHFKPQEHAEQRRKQGV